MGNLNETTLKIIRGLQDDLNEMLKSESNIEVAWKLERLHNDKSLKNNADSIRESLNNLQL